jgi:RNA polymerase sigma factor (sigma-70 family)
MDVSVPVVHVVDDDPSFRGAMGRLLRAAGYGVALYPSASDLLQQFPPAGRGCILLDVRMPGVTGPQLQARLSDMGCSLPIIFLTGYGDMPTAVRVIKAGAEDCLSKPVAKDDLLGAIDRALIHFDESHQRSAHVRQLRDLVTTLTPREREVYELVVRGKLNKQIAHRLGTSERTIKAHRHSIMQKLKARSLAELVSGAERSGLLGSDDRQCSITHG